MSLLNRNQVSKERRLTAFIWKIMQCSYISKLNRLHFQHDKTHLEETCVKYYIALIPDGFPAGPLSHIELMPNCCITVLPLSDGERSGFLFEAVTSCSHRLPFPSLSPVSTFRDSPTNFCDVSGPATRKGQVPVGY